MQTEWKYPQNKMEIEWQRIKNVLDIKRGVGTKGRYIITIPRKAFGNMTQIQRQNKYNYNVMDIKRGQIGDTKKI